ncbi:MAG TPA: metallophosphoesterase, partial [Conexibacter sp.]
MRLGVLADLHWSVAPQAGRAGVSFHAPYAFDDVAARCVAAVEALVAHGCELLVVAGDLTHDGDAASCAAALDCVLGASPIPVAVVEGNHDVLQDETLVARHGAVRGGWRRAARLAGAQLVALRAVGVDRDGRWALERGRATLAAGLPAVVASHFPLVPHATRLADVGLPFPGELAERDALLAQLVATRTPTVVLSGHLHVRDAICHDNVLQLCVAALVERPHEAAVVDVDPLGGAVRCTRIGSGPSAAADPGAERWLLAAPDERWDFAEGAWTRREADV